MLGDTVNIGSRLEALNRRYGTTILATAAVVKRAGPGFVWRHIDRVTVKGKARSVNIFQPLGMAGSVTEADLSFARRYEVALQSYFEGYFQDAVVTLEQLLNHCPEDGPTRRLLELCRRYTVEAPTGLWDGVTHYDTK